MKRESGKGRRAAQRKEATWLAHPVASHYDRGGAPSRERRPLTERAGEERPARIFNNVAWIVPRRTEKDDRRVYRRPKQYDSPARWITISEIVVFLRRFPREHGTNCTGGARGAVVFREAYGVRGACSRCPMCGAVRQREQAPRTPYASRGLVSAPPR